MFIHCLALEVHICFTVSIGETPLLHRLDSAHFHIHTEHLTHLTRQRARYRRQYCPHHRNTVNLPFVLVSAQNPWKGLVRRQSVI